MKTLRLLVCVAALWLTALAPVQAAGTPSTFKVYLPLITRNYMHFDGPQIRFGYGWGIFKWRNYWPANQQYPTTSFTWLKVTENPDPWQLCGSFRLPYAVLLQLRKADANATPQQVADDAWTWAHNMETAPGVNKCVEAFEIGNEPNLSGFYGGPVNPEKYADQLCAAYDAIKATDPSFIVVSGGLAATGGLPDETVAMKDTTFLRRMLDRIIDKKGNAGACFDVLAHHPYGFRVDFDHDPQDVACVERSCFRGVEEIFEILHGEYGVQKRIWATEIGWLRDFTAGGCSNAAWAPVFGGWQRSNQDQGTQLVGAYQYARQNWPWMGAMFVFNLDFNSREFAGPCDDEQGWFAVKGFAAETMLEGMSKP